MTTDLTDDDIRSRLDVASIDRAAAYVSKRLFGRGCAAIVHLAPGDATSYQLVVIPPYDYLAGGGLGLSGALGDEVREAHEYLVALVNCSGTIYPWNGQGDVHPSYAAQKWTTDGRRWTGVVVATFLNRLAELIAER